ncbi:MAG: PDZ domain-containing protein [Acidobacteriota bacterium]
MYSRVVLMVGLALAAPLLPVARPATGAPLAAAASSREVAGPPAEFIYRIDLTGGKAVVAARFPVRENKDFAFLTSSSQGVVSDLTVRDAAGERPVVQTGETGIYRVDGLAAGPVEATYTLTLATPCGRAACRDEGGVSVAGKDMILYPMGVDPDVESRVRVDFILPPTWSVVTSAGAAGSSLSVPTLSALSREHLLIGNQIAKKLPGGELLAVQKTGWQVGADDVAGLIGVAVAEQERLLGDRSATGGSILIRVTSASARRSASMVEVAPRVYQLHLDGRSERSAMAHQLVGPLATLFETRLSHAMAGAAAGSVGWWRVGFPRYTATLAAVRAGTLSQSDFIDRIFAAWRLVSAGSPLAGKVSLADAGSRSGDDAQEFVAAGGFLTCYLLDVRLRAASDGRVGLGTLLADMVGHTVDNGFLQDEVARMTSRDVGNLLRVSVLDSSAPPLPEEASRAALELVKAGTGEPFVGFSLEDDEPVIRRVFASGPARSMGLRAGDRITAVDGTLVSSVADVQAGLAGRAPGDAVGISVRTDDGQIYSAVLKLWERTETILRRAESAPPAARQAWSALTHGDATTFAN